MNQLPIGIENTDSQACPLFIVGDVRCDSEGQGAEF